MFSSNNDSKNHVITLSNSINSTSYPYILVAGDYAVQDSGVYPILWYHNPNDYKERLLLSHGREGVRIHIESRPGLALRAYGEYIILDENNPEDSSQEWIFQKI